MKPTVINLLYKLDAEQALPSQYRLVSFESLPTAGADTLLSDPRLSIDAKQIGMALRQHSASGLPSPSLAELMSLTHMTPSDICSSLAELGELSDERGLA